MRRVTLLVILAITVGIGVAACNSQGTVEPFPETIEGDVEAPEVAVGDAGAGAVVFIDAGCGGCHVLAGVDGATGTVGPDLTVVLAGTDTAYIQQSIVTPDAVISEGFTAGIMQPAQVSDEELADLVALLHESAGGS